jgi:hypothetical protein
MTGLFVKHLWGNNEYRFRLKKDMNRCVEQDRVREHVPRLVRLIDHRRRVQYVGRDQGQAGRVEGT